MSYQHYTPEDLELIEVQNEMRAHEDGMNKYLSRVGYAAQAGMEDQTDYGKRIIAGKLEKLADAIGAWKEASLSGRATRSALAARKLTAMPAPTLAYLTLKVVMQGISAERSYPSVAIELGAAIETELLLDDVKKKEAKYYSNAIRTIERSRGKDRIRNVMRGEIAPMLGAEMWDKPTKIGVGGALLEIAREAVPIFTVVTRRMGKNRTMHLIEPTPEIIQWIGDRVEVAQHWYHNYEPMVVPPRHWTGPWDGGYLTTHVPPYPLVKAHCKTNGYLESLEAVEMPIVYDAVNALQATRWQINSDVLDVMQYLWESPAAHRAFPPKDGISLPPKPYDIDDNEEARNAWRREAAKIHHLNAGSMGRRIGTTMLLALAKRYARFEAIHFPYQLDFRGRIYALPNLSPQGSDISKGLLRFADGKPVGTEGAKWLAIHGANTYGVDKVSYDDRIKWVQDNEKEILYCASNPYGTNFWVDGDSPWQFLAFCFEWAGYKLEGETYVSRIPVAMDGSCSGIQHFSAMFRDEIGGAAVNLTPSDVPADVYKKVADIIIPRLKHDLEHGTQDSINEHGHKREGDATLAAQWLAFGVNRKVAKRSVMTFAYGSKEFGYRDQLVEDVIRPAQEAAAMGEGKFPFTGDGYTAAVYMARHLWKAVNEVLVKAGEAMTYLSKIAGLVAKQGIPVRWNTPVGFPVLQAYYEMSSHVVRTHLHGKMATTSYTKETPNVDKHKQATAVAPNFVHSCDAAHLMLTVVRAKDAGCTSFAMIHDSYGTLAADTPILYKQVREAFIEMYETVDPAAVFNSDMLDIIMLAEKPEKNIPMLPKRGTLNLQSVRDSLYCFA